MPEQEMCGEVLYLMLIGGDKWPPYNECADERCDVRDQGDDIFARSALFPLLQMGGEFAQDLWGLGVRVIPELEME
jgi:hypothetical protein